MTHLPPSHHHRKLSVFCRGLVAELKYAGSTVLPRIPVPLQRQMLAELAEWDRAPPPRAAPSAVPADRSPSAAADARHASWSRSPSPARGRHHSHSRSRSRSRSHRRHGSHSRRHHSHHSHHRHHRHGHSHSRHRRSTSASSRSRSPPPPPAERPPEAPPAAVPPPPPPPPLQSKPLPSGTVVPAVFKSNLAELKSLYCSSAPAKTEDVCACFLFFSPHFFFSPTVCCISFSRVFVGLRVHAGFLILFLGDGAHMDR